MDRETGFLHSSGSGRWLSVGLLKVRGELAIEGTSSCHRLVCGRIVDPDHDAIMRIGGVAPGGGPILSVGISARFEYGIPPPRIVNPAVVLKSPARAPKMVVSGMLLSGCWT